MQLEIQTFQLHAQLALHPQNNPASDCRDTLLCFSVQEEFSTLRHLSCLTI